MTTPDEKERIINKLLSTQATGRGGVGGGSAFSALLNGSSSEQTVDPLALWKGAASVSTAQASAAAYSSRPAVAASSSHLRVLPSVGERFAGSRAEMWQRLGEIPPGARTHYLTTLFDVWPYWRERWGFIAPQMVLTLTNTLTATYIGAMINADVFLAERNLRFWDACGRPATNAPIIGILFCAGILLPIAFFVNMVRRPIIEDEVPLAFWPMYGRVAGIYLMTGVLIPMLATPYLSFFFRLKLQSKSKNRMFHNTIAEFLKLPLEYSRSVWPRVPHMVGAHVVVAASCTAIMLWARNRIHFTMETSPELICEIMKDPFSVEQKPSSGMKAWFEHKKALYMKFVEKMGMRLEAPKETRNSAGSLFKRKVGVD